MNVQEADNRVALAGTMANLIGSAPWQELGSETSIRRLPFHALTSGQELTRIATGSREDGFFALDLGQGRRI